MSNSTALVFPTSTYSRLSNPSSSVSPGITEASVSSGVGPRLLDEGVERGRELYQESNKK